MPKPKLVRAALTAVPFLAACPLVWAGADVRVSIVYTGRSLGALGVLRAQDEHELLTEQANAEGIPFKLVSHPCWRAPGLAIFTPSDEIDAYSLAHFLAARAAARPLGSFRALRSSNVVLVQDPDAAGDDLLAMLRRNARASAEFPDLQETTVRLARIEGPKREPGFILETEGADWPADPAAWALGEMNRVDVSWLLRSTGKPAIPRVFELPVNLAPIGSRATLLRRVVDEAQRTSAKVLVTELGGRDGDLGLPRPERARLDYTALSRMGYGLVVPFELELALGFDGLHELEAAFPGIAFLATNVKPRGGGGSLLFERQRILEAGGVRVGLIGLVDPEVRASLARPVLGDFEFEPLIDAAQREVHALRQAGVHAVVALSNLSPADNAAVARDVAGVDAVVADLHVRWSPENLRTVVRLPDRPASRPGSPGLVARGFANGLGVGRLDLVFERDGRSGLHLAGLSHDLHSVTDQIPADTRLVSEIHGLLPQEDDKKRGPLLVPAFVDLVRRRADLADFDATTAQGRISKRMWERAVARLLRYQGRAEVAMIRPFPHFPPLIGKLHEPEVRSWLWTEETIVVADVQGLDLKKIVEEDVRGELVLSGLDRNAWTVNGRRLDERIFYRVATTDVIFEGARFPDFAKARRVRREFQVRHDGSLHPSRSGDPLGLRDFVLGELKRIRSEAKGEAHLDRLAALLSPDPPFLPLLTFNFDRPTVWASLSRAFQNEPYASVPETRVNSIDSSVAGVNGRFVLTQDRERSAIDLGLVLAYTRQTTTRVSGQRDEVESADDLKLELTLRPKALQKPTRRLQPFLRGTYDTEFTPTFNAALGADNPRQQALRGTAGLLLAPSRHFREVQLGALLENDFAQDHLEAGLQLKGDFLTTFGARRSLSYRIRNDLTYFFPTAEDTVSDLGLTYNMVHEILVPLVDEMSLSVAADFFLFKGKVEATRKAGASVILRVGLSYERLWKPRHQPLF